MIAIIFPPKSISDYSLPVTLQTPRPQCGVILPWYSSSSPRYVSFLSCRCPMNLTVPRHILPSGRVNLATSPSATSAGDRGANGRRPAVMRDVLDATTVGLLCWVGSTGTIIDRRPYEGDDASKSTSSKWVQFRAVDLCHPYFELIGLGLKLRMSTVTISVSGWMNE